MRTRKVHLGAWGMGEDPLSLRRWRKMVGKED